MVQSFTYIRHLAQTNIYICSTVEYTSVYVLSIYPVVSFVVIVHLWDSQLDLSPASHVDIWTWFHIAVVEMN